MPSLKKSISIGVLLACIFLLGFYMRNHLSDFGNISSISFPYILVISIMYLLSLIVNGLFLKVLTVDFGIDLNFAEYFSISVVTSFGNIFLPMKGGAGFRAVYLKSRYNFEYSYFISSLAGNYLIAFNITSLVALAGMAALYFHSGHFNLPAAAVFLGIAVLTAWGILFPPVTLDWIPFKWPREKIEQVLSGWRITSKSRRTVLNLFCLALLNVILGSATTWFEFAAFNMKDAAGEAISFLQSVVFTTIGALSFLLSITPAALGIKESLLMFSSESLGISPSQALAVSLLDRTATFIVLALIFGFASIYLRKQLRTRSSAARADLSDCTGI
jgi:uncharacterized membrane protein YbhN (UPF0104 family)